MKQFIPFSINTSEELGLQSLELDSLNRHIRTSGDTITVIDVKMEHTVDSEVLGLLIVETDNPIYI